MYYIPLIILAILAFLEYKYKWKYAYFIGFMMLTLMLCLRYGQGTDYFGYLRNYHVADDHSELGYMILCKVFQYFKIRYEYLNGFIGLMTMLCFNRAIIKYSPWKNFTLMLIYPTLFLTYCFSATRQGFVIAFFLGFMLEWLEDEKWIKYLLACLVLATLHISALVLIPAVIINKFSVKKIYIMLCAAIVAAVILYCLPASVIQMIPLDQVRYYLGSHSVSVIGLAERCAMMLGIGALWEYLSRKGNTIIGQAEFLYKVYIYGFSIAIILMPWGLLSSRMSASLKATEILLLPILVLSLKAEHFKWIGRLATVMLVSYIFVMTTKNLYSYIQQGEPFYNGYNPITYPYINIVNKYEYMDVWFNHKLYQNFTYYRDLERGGLSYWPIY